MKAADQEAARKAAIEDHACGQSPPVTLEDQRRHVKAALDREEAKPIHKQQGTVLADLRRKLRDVEKNMVSST